MLMDLMTLDWYDHMLKDFEIKKECLPTINKSSSGNFGTVTNIECIKGIIIGG